MPRAGGDTDRLALELDRAAAERIDPEDGAGKLGAPGADQPGEAEDLAASDRQAHGAVRIGVGNGVDDVEHAVAGRSRGRQ